MDLFPLLLAGFVMLVVVLVVLGVSQLQGGSGKVLTRRLENYGQERPTAVKTATAGAVLRDVDHGRLGPLTGLLSGSHGVRSTAIELERAGIPLRVGEFMMIRFALAIILFLAPLVLMSGAMMAFIVAVGLGAFGYLLPRWYVGSRRRGRQARICSQLVEMITLVSTSLKSGYGLMKSFEFASEQLKPPLSTELKRMLQDASLGQGAEGALEGLAERSSSPDLDLVITAIRIHKTVGGNLAEVLDSVAYTMRERDRLRGEVNTLTSQQRMSGIIVGSLPIFVGLLFLLVNPDYMAPLFNETAGRMILLTAVGMEVLGFLAIRAILSFEV
jgi:tight adherence protein B